MDEMDEYQEWLHLTWGFGMESGVKGMKLEDKYRGMTEEEREEERRKLDAWAELTERGPGYAAPLCGSAMENDAYRA